MSKEDKPKMSDAEKIAKMQKGREDAKLKATQEAAQHKQKVHDQVRRDNPNDDEPTINSKVDHIIEREDLVKSVESKGLAYHKAWNDLDAFDGKGGKMISADKLKKLIS